MSEEHRRYLSYLLRLWQDGSGEEGIWRTSLQSPRSGERQGFADLEELMDFLKALTEKDKDMPEIT